MRRREPGFLENNTPEKELCIGILGRWWDDATLPLAEIPVFSEGERKNIQDSQRRIRARSRAWPRNYPEWFNTICYGAGFNPEAVRDRLQRKTRGR